MTMWEIDDILNDPMFDMEGEQAKLFDIPEEMRKIKERRQAEYVAQYRPCEDFEMYRSMFAKIHAELKAGKRHLIRTTKTDNLQPGRFFVVSGVLMFLEKVYNEYKDKGNDLRNGRTRCIFENGTETDILLQTLRKNVVGDGFAVTELEEEVNTNFFVNNVSEGDQVTGFIYVLQSLSSEPAIICTENLYKIGFTVYSVEERIANAENEPTYLMAPIKIVATYKIVNMNSHVFESLVHQVLDCVKFHITVTDGNGVEHHPSEWYVVPLEVIDTIIGKICNGTILDYSYNPTLQCLERQISPHKSTFNLNGRKVLRLTIAKSEFEHIVSGELKILPRVIRQNKLNTYTYVDQADGKRYLKRFDVIQLAVRGGAASAIVVVKDTTYANNIVTYHLGEVIESI